MYCYIKKNVLYIKKFLFMKEELTNTKKNQIKLNKIYETLDGLYKSIETIENKQLEMIKKEGVNTDLLGYNNTNEML